MPVKLAKLESLALKHDIVSCQIKQTLYNPHTYVTNQIGVASILNKKPNCSSRTVPTVLKIKGVPSQAYLFLNK